MYFPLKEIELDEDELRDLHQRVDADIEDRVAAAEQMYGGHMPVHNKNVLRQRLFKEAVQQERLAIYNGQDWQPQDDADGVRGQTY
jgi:hypothetical protein